MSSNSFLVDLRKSMIIANPQHFPMNMEKPTKEDYPVETYPIVAYDAKNVVPTPFGYKSFFEESTRLNIGNLAGKFVQKIFNYQTVNMDSVQFALCEDGIYVAFATEPTPANWARIVDLSATMVTGIRRLWTVAVISNVVYLYQAGQPKFWAIVDPAKYAEAASPSLIAGATRSQVWTNWATGLISYIPSFLNMAGQIGLFRADNRLGFWDSDNSVGWSSSVAIEDFKPDAKTFAGSTKFADVQGRIVKILGSGDSFVIYATRSIVNCVGLDNSPEKWRGEAIMSEVGVAFDSQIAAAQPDQIHYCITQAGLCAITAGSPEYIATEVMDYIAETFPLYSLTVIEGRYLFISVNGSFPGAEYGTESVIVNDWANNSFVFPRPTYPVLDEKPKDFIEDYIAGREHQIQESLKDYAPIVDVSTIPPSQQLQPCFDIKIFKSTWAETTFSPHTVSDEFFYSKAGPFAYDYVGPLYIEPVVTNNSIEVDDLAPGDFAGDEVGVKLDLGMTAFNKQVEYQNAIMQANEDPIVMEVVRDDVMDIGPEGPRTIEWPKELVDTRVLFDAIKPEEITAISANECRLLLKVPTRGKLKLKTFFEGTEEVGITVQYLINQGTKVSAAMLALGFPQSSVPVTGVTAGVWSYIKITYTQEQAQEGLLRYHQHYGTYGNLNPDQYYPWYAAAWFVRWLYVNYPDNVEFIGPITESQVVQSSSPIIQCPATADPADLSPLLVTSYGWYVNVDGTPISIFDGNPSVPGDPCKGSHYYYGPIDVGDDPLYKRFSTNGFYELDDISLPAFASFVGITTPTGAVCKLSGELKHEIEYEVVATEDIIVYEILVSGWGYYPSGGFSFRKTHSRSSSSGTCPIPSGSYSTTPPNLDLNIKLPPLDRPELNNPGYVWDYPDSIPLPDNYALFQKGSLGAYYPTYGAAAVYDLLLQKWGMYNNSHKLIQELMPVNRVDSSIMPVLDKGMFAGALNPASECTVFKDLNPQSRITYGKMAFYRRGMSLATGAIAHFGALATGTLIVEASMDGVTVDPLLSYAVPFVNQRNVTLPFTTRAKWFNIRVEGNFNLTYLELLAESRGRR